MVVQRPSFWQEETKEAEEEEKGETKNKTTNNLNFNFKNTFVALN